MTILNRCKSYLLYIIPLVGILLGVAFVISSRHSKDTDYLNKKGEIYYTKDNSIWRINLDGSEKEFFYESKGIIRDLKASPDNKFIAWVETSSPTQWTNQIKILNIKEKLEEKIPDFELVDSNTAGWVADFTWSPTGNQIAFLYLPPTQNLSDLKRFEIRIYELESDKNSVKSICGSAEITDSTSNPGPEKPIYWDPSNQIIYVYGNQFIDPNHCQIITCDLNTNAQQVLVDTTPCSGFYYNQKLGKILYKYEGRLFEYNPTTKKKILHPISTVDLTTPLFFADTGDFFYTQMHLPEEFRDKKEKEIYSDRALFRYGTSWLRWLKQNKIFTIYRYKSGLVSYDEIIYDKDDYPYTGHIDGIFGYIGETLFFVKESEGTDPAAAIYSYNIATGKVTKLLDEPNHRSLSPTIANTN